MSSYNDLRNLIIYKTIQQVGSSSYLRKQLPNYLEDNISFLDITEALSIQKLGSIASEGNPYIKQFFAEATINNKTYRVDNLISEKTAIIELCLKVAIELKINHLN